MSNPAFRRPSTTLIAAVLAVLAALLLTAPLLAADALLSEQRWRENSYGVSLRPPLASRMLTANSSDAIVRIAGEGNYFIEATIKTRKQQQESISMNWQRDDRDPAGSRDASRARGGFFFADEDLRTGKRRVYSIAEVGDIAVKQFAAVRPDAVLMDPGTKVLKEDFLDQKLPTVLIYYKLPNEKKGPWIVAQSLTQIDNDTIVMLKLEVAEAGLSNAKPIFEAVLKSLKVEDPNTLRKQREKLLANGEKWLASIDPKKRQAALVEEQWYRIRTGKTELGHMRVNQKTETLMNVKGVRIDMQAHYDADSQAFDTLANYFVSDDGDHEVWSVKTTTRPPKNSGAKGVGAMGLTVTESGVRDFKSIAVHRVTPKGEEDFNWDKPSVKLPIDANGNPTKEAQPVNANGNSAKDAPAVALPYLSLAEVQLLDVLLPHKAPLEVAFYCYFPQASKITLRTERVAPQPDGTCLVYSRLSPEQEEQVSFFDAKGKLVKRTLPSGQMWTPTTKSELAAKAGLVQP